jgi:S-DNA-T family DNA segregation ATPase FtsK/SpoIIIE
VVAAGSADALRSDYGHWTRAVRRARTGLLLRPDREVDGELLGTVLPRHQLEPACAGRGHLVAEGGAELVQVALPDHGRLSGRALRRIA